MAEIVGYDTPLFASKPNFEAMTGSGGVVFVPALMSRKSCAYRLVPPNILVLRVPPNILVLLVTDRRFFHRAVHCVR